MISVSIEGKESLSSVLIASFSMTKSLYGSCASAQSPSSVPVLSTDPAQGPAYVKRATQLENVLSKHNNTASSYPQPSFHKLSCSLIHRADAAIITLCGCEV